MIKTIIPRLPAKDLLATEQFYTQALSFRTINRYDDFGYLLLAYGDLEIHFYCDLQLAESENVASLYIRVDQNIEDLYTTLKQNKVRFADLGRLESKPWGQTEFAILDPNHTLLTFSQPTV